MRLNAQSIAISRAGGKSICGIEDTSLDEFPHGRYPSKAIAIETPSQVQPAYVREGSDISIGMGSTIIVRQGIPGPTSPMCAKRSDMPPVISLDDSDGRFLPETLHCVDRSLSSG